VLPSRPRLQGWDPGSLTTSASTISTSAEAISNAVNGVGSTIEHMPEAGAWEGKSHSAATAMFGRANRETLKFSEYANDVATALRNGSGPLGNARTALLNKANQIDQGELYVADNWVVLIKPVRMSAEKAADLQKQARSEQAAVNQMLLAVGDADEDTANAVTKAGANHGFSLPYPNDPSSVLVPGQKPPGDDVPNPRTFPGMNQQEVIRGEDMATAVRDSSEKDTSDGQHVTTLMMQDGSMHKITRWGGPEVDNVADDYYDPSGKWVVGSHSWNDPFTGVKSTSIEWADHTVFTTTVTADGKRTAGIIMPNGRQGTIPADSPFFAHPVPSTVGGALTYLDVHAAQGGGIPMLTSSSVENVGKAARYAGPVLGIATSAYDVMNAANFHEACVAGISGAFGIYGGDLSGTGAAAGATALGVPELAPFAAGTGSVFGGWLFGWAGTQLGEVICPQ
jgi:uncharacterized protein YukE